MISKSPEVAKIMNTNYMTITKSIENTVDSKIQEFDGDTQFHGLFLSMFINTSHSLVSIFV